MKATSQSILFLALMLVGPAAMADGAVIVGPGTKVDKLDVEQVKRIFLGREATLGGAPTAVIFHKAGPVRDVFDGSVLGKPGAQLTTYWSKLVFTGKAKAPEEVAGDAEVRAKVASTPGAIGYVSSAAVDASVRKVFEF